MLLSASVNTQQIKQDVEEERSYSVCNDCYQKIVTADNDVSPLQFFQRLSELNNDEPNNRRL